MAINLLDTLQESINTLRPSERKVAVVVLSDPTITSKATLSEIAGLAGVSEPTVLRFARTLGFDGFQDLEETAWKKLAAQQFFEGYSIDDAIYDLRNSVRGK